MQEYDGYKAEQRSKAEETEKAAELAAKRAKEQAKLENLKTKFKNI